jgi:uncharacterized Zn-binding protein involved in type VI secretion
MRKGGVVGQPAAKQGDQVTATDVHLIQPPGPSSPVPTPHPFAGIIDGGLAADVKIMGMPAATQGSTASNTPPHVPVGGSFVKPPSNRATVQVGSATVKIGGKPACRNGDLAMTCNDPADLPAGTVVAAGTVMIG